MSVVYELIEGDRQTMHVNLIRILIQKKIHCSLITSLFILLLGMYASIAAFIIKATNIQLVLKHHARPVFRHISVCCFWHFMSLLNSTKRITCTCIIHVYHITYGPGVQEHSAINRINALVQYRFLFPRFSLISLLQTGNK